MFNKSSISVAASLALVGSLTLTGCIGESNSAATTNNETTTKTQNTVQEKHTGSIEGVVKLLNNPTNRSTRSNDATSQITAYNLDNNTKYVTTTDADGNYLLADLTEGNYQVIATSTQTNKRSVRQVNVQRDTRSVVDIVLEATGSIKGTIDLSTIDYDNPGVVMIPGTSYLSTIDENGNFHITNVPSGEVTIAMFSGDSKVVSVNGGEATEIGTWNLENNDEPQNFDYINYVQTPRYNSTLEMQHDGIRVDIYNFDLEQFKDMVTLVDSEGITIELEIELDYHDKYDNRYDYSIESTSTPQAGTYTLQIAFSEDKVYEKSFVLEDKVAVFDESYNGNGIYKKAMGIAFSTPLEELDPTLVTITDEDGTILTVDSVEKVEQDEDPAFFLLEADFDSTKTYTVILDSTIAESGVFYPDQYYSNKDSVTIGDVDVSGLYDLENRDDVSLDQSIDFYINGRDALDLQTLQVTINDVNYTIQNGGIKSGSYDYYYDYWYNSDEFTIVGNKLDYDANVTMSITANDSYGDKAIDKTIEFKTIKPQTVGVEPYDRDRDDLHEWFDLGGNGLLRAYFNVDVDKNSGYITLHDDTNDKDIDTKPHDDYYNRIPYSNNTDTPYDIRFDAKEIMPNTTYTMTVAGYKTPNGYELEEKTHTFTTPKAGVISLSARNGDMVDADYLENTFEFAFFGKLSDEQKDNIVNNLTITSAHSNMQTDATHPIPIAIWEDEVYGQNLILAFTIEDGKSYEIDFAGSEAQRLGIDSSKLTFMTRAKDIPTNEPTDSLPYYEVIDYIDYGITYDENLSKGGKAGGSFRLEVPVNVTDEYYYYDENGTYHNSYSDCYNNTDINSSLVKEWISGDDINITYTNAYTSFDHGRSRYDRDGNYLDYFYTCNVIYNGEFTTSSEADSSVNITVPEHEMSYGIDAGENNITRVLDPRVFEQDYRFDIYGGYNNELEISFNFPVSKESLEQLLINTNPITNIKIDPDDYNYFDNEGNKYVDNVKVKYDSTNYGVLQINIDDNLTYFDVPNAVTKDMNIKESEVIYTDADFNPLSYLVTPFSEDNKSIFMMFNADVEIDSIFDSQNSVSAFQVKDDQNNTIGLSSILGTEDCWNGTDDCKVRVGLSQEMKTNTQYTIEQISAIKKDDSFYTIPAGQTWKGYYQYEEVIVEDDNTTSEDDNSTDEYKDTSDSPIVGTWVDGTSMDTVVVFLTDTAYFMAKGVADAGEKGGIEVGEYTLDGFNASEFTTVINSNGDDTLVGTEIVYDEAEDTITIDSDLTLTRQDENPYNGAWITMLDNGENEEEEIFITVIDESNNYMAVGFDFNSTDATEDGYNVFEIGTVSDISVDENNSLLNIAYNVSSKQNYNDTDGYDELDGMLLDYNISTYPVIELMVDENTTIPYLRVQQNGPLTDFDDSNESNEEQ
jgi:hypothetical protein